MFLVLRLISVTKTLSSSVHWARDQEDRYLTKAPRLYRHLEMTVLTARADAFLIEIARMEVISFCFITAKEVESPGFFGYSTPRLLNVLSDLVSCPGRKPEHDSETLGAYETRW